MASIRLADPREGWVQMNIVGALLPGICLLCRRRSRRDVDLCLECEAALERNDWACPVCAEPGPPGPTGAGICGACIVAPPPWRMMLAPFTYAAPLTRVVEGLKSGNGLRQARALGMLLAASAEARYRNDVLPDALIPMPLTRRRFRKRGFNQAELLAGVVGRALNRPLAKGRLIRTRDAPPQRTLPRSARLGNVRGAFAVRVRSPLRLSLYPPLPPRVALVDDVTTTGATVRAATDALRAAGASEVDVWVAAKTPTSRTALSA